VADVDPRAHTPMMQQRLHLGVEPFNGKTYAETDAGGAH
jgi:hypothetical protein